MANGDMAPLPGNAAHGTLAGSSMDRLLLAAAVAAAGGIIVFLALPLFFGKMFLGGDLLAFHLPLRFFYARSLAAGDSFAWMPDLFCGFYAQGEGEGGMYHPLHLLLYRVMPLATAFQLELLLNYLVMLAGAYLLLRRWRLLPYAALFGATAFAFSGYNLLHFIHPNHIAVAAHLPWLLLTADVILRSRERLSVAEASLGMAAVTGSELLVGHPQILFYSFLLLMLYVLLQLRLAVSAVRLLWLGMGVGVGILIGAAQLLPTVAFLSESTRQAVSSSFPYWYSLHPANLIQLVSPHFFGWRWRGILGAAPHEFGLYCGAVTLALACLAVFRRERMEPFQRRLVGGAAGLCALSLILAFGKYGYLYRVQAQIPVIGDFRDPCRYILLFHLGMAVLATIGLVEVRASAGARGPSSGRRLWPLLLVAAAAVLAAAVGLWPAIAPESWLGKLLGRVVFSTSDVLLGCATVLCGTILVWLAARGGAIALVALIPFAGLDLGFYGLRYVERSPAETMSQVLEGIPVLPERQKYRVYATGYWNQLIMQGAHLYSGYGGFTPSRELRADARSSLRLAGVRWIRGEEEDLPAWAPKLCLSTEYGWRMPDPLPRARLVARAVVSGEPAEDAGKIDLATAALVSQPVQLRDGAPGTAVILEDKPGRALVATSAEDRRLLVFSESFHPGWQAFVDGARCPVLRVNGDFIGCVVGGGRHEVLFRFAPASLRYGCPLSLLGAAILCCGAGAVLLYDFRLRRRRSVTGGPTGDPP